MSTSSNEQHKTQEDPPPLAEPLLDASAAATLLAVRPSWVYEAVRHGTLPHIKIGRHIRFLRTDLETWVLGQRRRNRDPQTLG